MDNTIFVDMSNEQVAAAYDNLKHKEDDIAAEKEVLKQEILARLKTDGEVWGDYTVNKVVKTTFVNVNLDEAEKYGAVKRSVDSAMLQKLKKKGLDLPFETKETIYPQIKRISEENKS